MPWREFATRTHPDNLRVDKNVISFLQEYFKTGKPVGVICHGPWTLVEADLVRGRTITSYLSIRTDLRNAGADVRRVGARRPAYSSPALRSARSRSSSFSRK